jgi:hypothetical protein
MADYDKQNVKLWDSVKHTNPKHIRGFDKGTYKGTATDPIHLYRVATEHFGPCGIGWGWTVTRDEVITDDTDPSSMMHYMEIDLWYQWGGEVGHIPCCGGTPLAYTAKSGRRMVDEDAKKKSLTDAITKGLSFLGFTADVRLGMFDDEKYTQQAAEHWRDRYKDARADNADADPMLAQPDERSWKVLMAELNTTTNAAEKKAIMATRGIDDLAALTADQLREELARLKG